MTSLAAGVVGFFTVSSRPGFSAMRSVDVLQLVASGMCFGVALVALVVFIRGKGISAD